MIVSSFLLLSPFSPETYYYFVSIVELMFFTSEKILKHKEKKRSDMTSIANTVNKLL